MICPYCGSDNLEGRYVCEGCGRMLLSGQTSTKQLTRTTDTTPLPPTGLRETLAPDEIMLIIQATYQIIRMKVPTTGIIIGRKDASAGIVPDVDLTSFLAYEWGISRRHCCISRRDGKFFARDLNSVNGVRVNGVKIEPGIEKQLNSRDVLHLGMLAIRVQLGGAEV